MKTINIISIAVLGWIAVSYADKPSSTTAEKQGPSSASVSKNNSECSCDLCESCSCKKDEDCKKIKKKEEVAVEQDLAPADNFSRPRKPCPSGPGKK